MNTENLLSDILTEPVGTFLGTRQTLGSFEPNDTSYLYATLGRNLCRGTLDRRGS